MRHYFINQEHNQEDYFTFEDTMFDKKYVFRSCKDVFSKSEIDYGSRVLINTIDDHAEEYSGDILDMCCGYGTISIVMTHRMAGINIDMCDINATAVELARENVNLNNCDNIGDIFVSDAYQNVKRQYNHIVSNPPIKVGKKVLFGIVGGAKDFLIDGGSITVVIKKNLGADSLKKYMVEVFGNCEILERDKGYYILRSIK